LAVRVRVLVVAVRALALDVRRDRRGRFVREVAAAALLAQRARAVVEAEAVGGLCG
jgi:hypothetical protein